LRRDTMSMNSERVDVDTAAKKKWDECLVLESNSEFVINAVQTIAAMGLKTEAELQEILEKSRTNLVV